MCIRDRWLYSALMISIVTVCNIFWIIMNRGINKRSQESVKWGYDNIYTKIEFINLLKWWFLISWCSFPFMIPTFCSFSESLVPSFCKDAIVKPSPFHIIDLLVQAVYDQKFSKSYCCSAQICSSFKASHSFVFWLSPIFLILFWRSNRSKTFFVG